MSVPQILSTVVCLIALAWPGLSAASYRIELRNGRHVVTSQYWKQGSTIMFYTDGGVAGVAESAVLRIQTVDDPTEPDLSRAAERKAVHNTNVQQERERTRALDLEAYRQKKEEMKAQIDMAIERYREASSTHNNEEKAKIQREITAWSKKIFDLTDEVKQMNHGRLPEGWENF